MIAAYDLDGVLCEPPPKRGKAWNKCNGVERAAWYALLLEFYRTAQPLYDPPEDEFYIITARKNEPDVVKATLDWLSAIFDGRRVRWVYYLATARSLENNVAFKRRSLLDCKAQKFTEDNRKVVKLLDQIWRPPGRELYLFKPATQERVLQPLDAE